MKRRFIRNHWFYRFHLDDACGLDHRRDQRSRNIRRNLSSMARFRCALLKQYERGVVFLLGKFAGVRGPGLTLIFAPIQQMTRVSLRTVTMQIPRRRSSPRTTSRSISPRSPITTSAIRKRP